VRHPAGVLRRERMRHVVGIHRLVQGSASGLACDDKGGCTRPDMDMLMPTVCPRIDASERPDGGRRRAGKAGRGAADVCCVRVVFYNEKKMVS
jgi:hypothetical protein